jgi:O-methyltransferase involved in polyketide biosynthesis
MGKENISSAEMTAFWRSNYPQISKDSLSQKLASSEGVQKAHEFEEKYQYPLVGRKVSVRAGWCLQQATEALMVGEYDSCISLGSGFSLLTYHIAAAVSQQKKEIKFFDVDLPEIIQLRKERMARLLINNLVASVLSKIEMLIINLESAFQEKKKFKDLFPNCKSPVFIIEGIIYFLSKDCVQWIYNSIASYEHSAVIFDYWPENGPNISRCFRQVLSSLDSFIPEKTRGLVSQKELAKLCGNRLIKDISLQDAETKLSQAVPEKAQLVNKDEFIPVRLAVAGTFPIKAKL